MGVARAGLTFFQLTQFPGVRCVTTELRAADDVGQF